MALSAGFEPATSWFVAKHSIQTELREHMPVIGIEPTLYGF